MEIDENKTDPEVQEYWESRTGQPYGDTSEPSAPVVVYSLNLDAEELLTTYGGLRTYLKVLSQQDNEDLEAIQRVVKIMIQIKPQAVEASKSLALKSVTSH